MNALHASSPARSVPAATACHRPKIARLILLVAPLIALAWLVMAAGPAKADAFGQLSADAQNARNAKNAGITPHPGHKIPTTLTFTDSHGKTVTLAQFFHKGRPVILNFVYFRCPGVCNYVQMGLLHALNHMGNRIGHDYDVITVSFDPTDSWQAAADKKAAYLAQALHPKAVAKHWHFLVGKEASIVPLTSAVGFHYVFYPATHIYNHSAAIYVLTPGARLSNYFFGIKYHAAQLNLALVQAGDHRISNIFDQVLLLCCSFDPNIGKYTPIALRVMSLAGVGVVLGLSAMFGTLFYWERKHRPHPIPTTESNKKDNTP